MSVLVIIPALNEAATLPEVLRQLRAELPDCDVVVVDDGSTDDTAAVARAAGAEVLSLPFNLGIGGALRTGFRYAVARGYQRAVQLDADGQHEPAAIRTLLAALDDGADFVVGSRFEDVTANYEVGLVRRTAMRTLELILRLLTGRTFTDTSSGFRAFDRPVLEYFARTYPSEYMESVEALLAAHSEGFRIVQVPIKMNARAGGTPSTIRFKLVYHYVRVILTMSMRVTRRRSVRAAAARQDDARGTVEGRAGSGDAAVVGRPAPEGSR